MRYLSEKKLFSKNFEETLVVSLLRGLRDKFLAMTMRALTHRLKPAPFDRQKRRIDK